MKLYAFEPSNEKSEFSRASDLVQLRSQPEKLKNSFWLIKNNKPPELLKFGQPVVRF